ncbi:hypothetical protein CANINC_000932 [Pichia inconspicua]|uniref:Prokaryotic-type class I peptide chain release factors domain-containing protein n=1 Tax=Pichia inconspicua TaxID=52247 RepID=A0A4T0X699_9ASCO|nr:hypothetical protein CANINC_000932 [[Candida] inconspicua]
MIKLLFWNTPTVLFRVYSTSTKSKLSQNQIAKYFKISYARSSGAGGQHVNTTDSKAVIKLSSSDWYGARGKWIPADSFDSIMHNLNDPTAPQMKRFPYFTQSGDVLVTDSSTRYREKNLSQCFEKFINAIDVCSQLKEEVSKETVVRWSKLKRRDNENRLKEKKLQKDKKQARRKISLSD